MAESDDEIPKLDSRGRSSMKNCETDAPLPVNGILGSQWRWAGNDFKCIQAKIMMTKDHYPSDSEGMPKSCFKFDESPDGI